MERTDTWAQPLTRESLFEEAVRCLIVALRPDDTSEKTREEYMALARGFCDLADRA